MRVDEVLNVDADNGGVLCRMTPCKGGARRPSDDDRATLQAEPMGKPVDRLTDSLATPRSFGEIVGLLDGVHQRDLLARLGSLRASGALEVDASGRCSVWRDHH